MSNKNAEQRKSIQLLPTCKLYYFNDTCSSVCSKDQNVVENCVLMDSTKAQKLTFSNLGDFNNQKQ